MPTKSKREKRKGKRRESREDNRIPPNDTERHRTTQNDRKKLSPARLPNHTPLCACPRDDQKSQVSVIEAETRDGVVHAPVPVHAPVLDRVLVRSVLLLSLSVVVFSSSLLLLLVLLVGVGVSRQ